MEDHLNIIGKVDGLQLLFLVMSHHTKILMQLLFPHTVCMFINSIHLELLFFQSIQQDMVLASVIFRFQFNM